MIIGAHRVHLFPVRSQRSVRIACPNTGVLQYHGGPVQTQPKVYVVFWGTNWQSTSGDPDGEASYLIGFYSADGGSKWLSTVTQYAQSDGQRTGNQTAEYSGSWFDTSSVPAAPSDTQLGNEAQKAATHFGVSGVNTQIVVATPHGIVPSGFMQNYCAWHSAQGTFTFTNLPYIPDAGTGCGAKSVTSSVLDGVSIVAGHEQAESATDPDLNAWMDASGNEVGDLCEWTGLSLGVPGFATQALWSNSADACI